MATTTVDVTNLILKFNFLEQVVADELENMLMQAAEIGAETARASLDVAETNYGRYRMSIGRGNTAGRNDTGSMINDLRALPPKVSEGKVEVKFGWGRGRSKGYYDIQEEGSDKFNTHITGAHSLLDGKRAVLNELPRLERNMKARISRKMKNK